MAKTMRKKNLKIQILAGNTLMSRFHVGFEIKNCLEWETKNFVVKLIAPQFFSVFRHLICWMASRRRPHQHFHQFHKITTWTTYLTAFQWITEAEIQQQLTTHSELKLRKKSIFAGKKRIFWYFQKYKNTFFDIFKSTKTHFVLFQKWGEIHFCTKTMFLELQKCNFWTEKKTGFSDWKYTFFHVSGQCAQEG